jgi:hypothetical protein
MTLQLSGRDLVELDGGLCDGAEHVRRVDASNNRLTRCMRLQCFSALEALDLARNDLADLPPSLPPTLTRLDVSHNCIQDLSSLAELPRLATLLAGANALVAPPFALPATLLLLDLRANGIVEMAGCFDHCQSLRALHLDDNMLEDPADLEQQVSALSRSLRHLSLLGNPACDTQRHQALGGFRSLRLRMLNACPNLESYDHQEVTDTVRLAQSPDAIASSSASVTAATERASRRARHELSSTAVLDQSRGSVRSSSAGGAPRYKATTAPARSSGAAPIASGNAQPTSDDATMAQFLALLYPPQQQQQHDYPDLGIAAAPPFGINNSRPSSSHSQRATTVPSNAPRANNDESPTQPLSTSNGKPTARPKLTSLSAPARAARIKALQRVCELEAAEEARLRTHVHFLRRRIAQEAAVERVQGAEAQRLQLEAAALRLEVETLDVEYRELELRFLEARAARRQKLLHVRD